MASEPTDEGAVRVALGSELDEWLRSQAAAAGVEPETLLVQLVASYRAAAELDGELGDGAGLAIEVSEGDALEELVEAAVTDAVGSDPPEALIETLEAAMSDRFEAIVADRVSEQLADADAIAAHVDDALEARLDDAVESRLGAVREDFRAKLEDVRTRVLQVKQEADAKAPADHEHEAFARVDAIGGRVADLEESLEDLEATVEAVRETAESASADADETVAEMEEEVADLEERLTTVAWVVSDLREAYESTTGTAALEQIKRGAAAADVARAACENCGEGVEIGLLTEPACPHCGATVTTFKPASGFFSNAQLLVASQLESGEDA